MQLLIGNKILRGTIEAPLSKSAAQRYLIASALSGQETIIQPFFPAGDILTTLNCLKGLGFSAEKLENGIKLAGRMNVKGEESLPAVLDCEESATALRLMLPLTAALGFEARFEGKGNLPSRPLKDLLLALTQKGIEISAEQLPLSLSGVLQGGEFILPGHISSQYFSGLLLALPILPQDSKLYYSSPLQSKGYIDLTLAVLKEFSIEVESITKGFLIPGGQVYRSPAKIRLPGDWSGASFYLLAGALSEEGVKINGLKPESGQSDEFILDVLKLWGASVLWEDEALRVVKGSRQALHLDLRQCPDLAPVIAVMAALTPNESTLKGLVRLRLKESDRLEGIIKLIEALGAEFNYDEEKDLLKVRGSFMPKGRVFDAQNDHRLIMAATVAAGSCQNPLKVVNGRGVEKSYPGFFTDFQKLGGEYHVLTNRT